MFVFRLLLGVTARGTVTAMKKEGSGSLDVASVDDMLQVYMILALKLKLELRFCKLVVSKDK